jgi:methylenetetrahydrofolate dehydrogenase (NADP+)/methenyltetrahydrofolate cyclohydrolase
MRAECSHTPSLAIFVAGNDQSAAAYRDSIERVATAVGLLIELVALPEHVDSERVLRVIDELNERDDVNGVIILQPLPRQLSRVEIADRLDPLKDIDGITTFNAGRLFHDDRDVLAPSTPAGGMALLKYYDVQLAGRHAVVVGRSPVVGKPMAMMLMAEHATVSICHSRTPDVGRYTRQADVLVAAAGQPGLIDGSKVRPGAVVLDFGVSFVGEQMVGDVDAESVSQVASALTPVPGGTGRVTPAVLIRNALKATRLQLRHGVPA